MNKRGKTISDNGVSVFLSFLCMQTTFVHYATDTIILFVTDNNNESCCWCQPEVCRQMTMVGILLSSAYVCLSPFFLFFLVVKNGTLKQPLLDEQGLVQVTRGDR